MMMKLMSRILSFALMLSVVFTFGVAEENVDAVVTDEQFVEIVDEESVMVDPCATSCSHSEYEMIDDPDNVMPTIMKYDSVYHKSAKVMKAICLKKSCAKVITVYVNTQYIPHTLTDNGNEHLDGKLIHRYNQKCEACGFTTYYEVYCVDCE